jgi:tetratricopeptide (TPR) repeat protein
VAPTETNVLGLAEHLLSIDKHEAALETLSRASSDQIDSPDYWAIRAQALLELERYEASRKAARRGLERHPEDMRLLAALALSELELGFPEDALEALGKALEVSPDDPVLLALRALAFAHRLDFDEAEAGIEEALRVAPDLQPVLQVRAQIAVLANDRRANQYIDDLVRIDPEDRFAQVLRGRAARKRKRFVAASRAWDEAARLDPGNREIVAAAREARIVAHPLVAPARAMSRMGRWPFVLLVSLIMVVLTATEIVPFWLLTCLWLLLVVLIRFGPRYVRWNQNRKYGEF